MMAGNLRSQINIERYTESIDEYGQPIKTWQNIHTVRANVRQTTGKERFINAEKISTSTHIFKLRYLDATTLDRINYNGKYYDIMTTINVNERTRCLYIVAKEVENE